MRRLLCALQVVADECEWQMDDGMLVITLRKQAAGWWERVLAKVRARRTRTISAHTHLSSLTRAPGPADGHVVLRHTEVHARRDAGPPVRALPCHALACATRLSQRPARAR